jgi:hypothetical protein
MTALSDEKIRSPPNIATADTTAVQAQLLEASATQKDVFIVTVDGKGQDVTPKKPAEGGLKNYFVSCLLDELLSNAKCNTSASFRTGPTSIIS